MIPLRNIWILNFATTVGMLTGMSMLILSSLGFEYSDMGLFYLVGITGLFIVLLTYLFYRSIYKWGQKSRLPFYLVSLLPLGLSGLLLYENLGDVDVNYTTSIITVLIFSGLNLVTYFLGLTIKMRGMRHSHQQKL